MEKSKRSWVAVLFGLSLLLAGVGAFWFSAGSMLSDYFNSADWEQVPAEILEIELATKKGSDSTTYSVQGRYQYYVNGAQYTSSRISLSRGSDNLSDYWQELYQRLYRDRVENRSVALVNPSDPSQALLDRTLRWSSVMFGLIFLMLFGGFGGVVAWYAWRGKADDERNRQNTSQGVYSQEKSGYKIVLWIGAVVLVIGLAVSFLALPEELPQGHYKVLLVLVFPLAGFWLLFMGWKQRAQYFKFGATPLFLDPNNPVVGGQFGAWFELSFSDLSTATQRVPEFTASLTCTKRYRSNDKTRSSIIWQETVPVYAQQTLKGIKVLVKFDIPSSCKPSKEWDASHSIEWELSVQANFDAQGMGDIERTWDVFVNKLEPHAQPSVSNLAIPQNFVDQVQSDLAQQSSESALNQIQLSQSDRYLEVLSAPARHLNMSLFLLAFGLVFLAAGVFTVSQNWWPGYVFILFGVGMSLGAIYSIGSGINSKIDKAARLIHTQYSFFGWIFSKKECAIFNAEQFSIKRTMSSQSDKKRTEYFDVLINYNGKKVKIAKSIKGKRAAQFLLDEITGDLF